MPWFMRLGMIEVMSMVAYEPHMRLEISLFHPVGNRTARGEALRFRVFTLRKERVFLKWKTATSIRGTTPGQCWHCSPFTKRWGETNIWKPQGELVALFKRS